MSKTNQTMRELTQSKLKEDLMNQWLYFRHPHLVQPIVWESLIIRNIDFSKTNLEDATFRRCSFFNTKIGKANLAGAKFEDCKVDDYQKTFGVPKS